MFKGIAVAIIIAIFDQLSKNGILAAYYSKELPVEVTGFFSLVLAWNPGISFGMFNNFPYTQWIFSAVAIVISIILLIWMKRAGTMWMIIALGLVVGGAIGNTIDRIRYGAVVDFLDFHIGDYHWPAFNIADSAIFIGVFMLILDSLFLSKNTEDGKQEQNDQNL